MILQAPTMYRKRAAKDRGVDSDEDMRKIASLKPDYVELQREVRAIKKRLQRAKLKQDNLLAEVRFLRRKLKMFKQRDSEPKGAPEMPANQLVETWPVDVRLASATPASPCKEEIGPQGPALQRYLPPDCCQASETEPLAAKEFQVLWEPLKTAGPAIAGTAKKQPLVCNNGLVSALKSPLFKNSPNGCVTQMTGKRRISWHDQISLKV